MSDRFTGAKRQVDIAVFTESGGRVYLRMVEVRDRSRKVGEQFIDEVLGKRDAIGAHRATIVTTAGFAARAIDRIRAHSHILDAFDLKAGRPGEWPERFKGRTMDFSDGEGVRETVELQHRRYRNAITHEVLYEVFFGTWARARSVVCVLTPPEFHDASQISIIGLDRGGIYNMKSVQVDYTTYDDEGIPQQGSVKSEGRSIDEGSSLT